MRDKRSDYLDTRWVLMPANTGLVGSLEAPVVGTKHRQWSEGDMGEGYAK